MAAHDTLIETLQRNGTLADIADALDLSPDYRMWLASKRIAEPASERHGRALCDNRLMRDELELPRAVRLATITRQYYPDDSSNMPVRVVKSDVPKVVKHIADKREAWLRSDPDRLARHLANLLPREHTNCASD